MADVIKREICGILWRVEPKLIDGGANGMAVEMQWGWTAWMTDEELKEYAEDAPTGYESVITSLDDARVLRDALTAILDSEEAKFVSPEHAALVAENQRLGALLHKATIR